MVSRIYTSRIQPTQGCIDLQGCNDHKDEFNSLLKSEKSFNPLKNLQTALSITFLLRNGLCFRVFEGDEFHTRQKVADVTISLLL